jgi:hypothetical protein
MDIPIMFVNASQQLASLQEIVLDIQYLDSEVDDLWWKVNEVMAEPINQGLGSVRRVVLLYGYSQKTRGLRTARVTELETFSEEFEDVQVRFTVLVHPP